MYLDLSSLGYLAPLVSFILGTLQAIFPYIPFVVLAGTNGLVFGFYYGFLISFSGALFGALISFWLARKWGQAWVLAKFGEKYKEQIKQFSSAYGFRTVLVARLIPIIPSPLINVLSGVSKIKFKDFTISSAIGKFPFAAVYTLAGNEISKSENINLFAIAIAVALVGYYTVQHYRKKSKSKNGPKI